MIEITNHVEQDVTINSDANLHGMISGNVSIEKPAVFMVHGMVNGNITIQNNSTLIVHGTINGNIINMGHCKIFGMVDGSLIENGGKFDIDPKAQISSR